MITHSLHFQSASPNNSDFSYKYFSHSKVKTTVTKGSESLCLGRCLSLSCLCSQCPTPCLAQQELCVSQRAPIPQDPHKRSQRSAEFLWTGTMRSKCGASVSHSHILLEKWGSLAYASEDRIYLEIAPKSINNLFTKAVGVF